MSLKILLSKRQIADARCELYRRNLSCATSTWKKNLQRFGVWPGIVFGDHVKSWDVLKTVEFIQANVANDEAILDIGAYASEVPLILHRLGYRRLAGLDLNPDIGNMPFPQDIDYRVGDFLRTPFADGSFQVVTAISVIEHGFQDEALVFEMARILRPGGLFVASFDYWPDKIATDGIDMFGLTWTIFSRCEVEQFLALAGAHSLVPCGALSFDSAERSVSCADRNYTFGWMALKKSG